jgi:hypothetical protein
MTTSKTKKTTVKKPTRQLAHTRVRLVEDYAVPGGLVLGAGIATATGILFRRQLGTLGRLAAAMAVRESITAAKWMDSGNLLASIGLQKRRPALRMAEAGLGAFGGLVAGSAIALWFARGRSRSAQTKLGARAPGALTEDAAHGPQSNSVGRMASSHA